MGSGGRSICSTPFAHLSADEEDNGEGWTVCTKRKASKKKKIEPSHVSKLTVKSVPPLIGPGDQLRES